MCELKMRSRTNTHTHTHTFTYISRKATTICVNYVECSNLHYEILLQGLARSIIIWRAKKCRQPMERIAPLYSCLYFSALHYISRRFSFFFITKSYTVLPELFIQGLIWPKRKAYKPFHVVLNSGIWPLHLFGTLDVTSFVLQLIDGLVSTFVPAMCGRHWFTHLYTTLYGIHRLLTNSHICYQY